jgi:hypothetical protein
LSWRKFQYVLLGSLLFVAVETAYAIASLDFPNPFKDWTIYVLIAAFLIFTLWIVLVLNGPDRSRVGRLRNAAIQLGAQFFARPTVDDIALPKEFRLARAATYSLLPVWRRPRNLFRWNDKTDLVVFDMLYGQGRGSMETTSAYLAEPIPGIPDWPTDAPFLGAGPGGGKGPPEPYALVLAANREWTVECQGGQLLVYRLNLLCQPESYSEFVAEVLRISEAIKAAAMACHQ